MAHTYFSFTEVKLSINDTLVLVIDVPGPGVAISFIYDLTRVDFTIYLNDEDTITDFVQALRFNGSGDIISDPSIRQEQGKTFKFLVDKDTLNELKTFIDLVGINYFDIVDYRNSNFYEVLFIPQAAMTSGAISADLHNLTVTTEVS